MKSLIFILIIIIILIGLYFLFIMLFSKCLNIRYQVNGTKTKHFKILIIDEQEDIQFLYSPKLHKNGSSEFWITFPRKNKWSLLTINVILSSPQKEMKIHQISLKKDYYRSTEEIILSNWSQLENNLFLHQPYARVVIFSNEEIPDKFSIFLNIKLKDNNKLKKIKKTIHISKTRKWRYHGFWG